MNSSDSSIGLVIPAYNASAHIRSVIERIPRDAWAVIRHIWIVNDGSTDDTGSVIDSLAQSNPVISPVHLQRNKGYGTAVRIGLWKCQENLCDYAVCLHADGQYPPESIPSFIDFMKKNSTDILQGSRLASGTALSGGMPLYKFIAGKVLTFLENRVFGLCLSDYHSGFLVYSRRGLDTLQLYHLSKSFDFDLEVIASARSFGLKIAELPIQTRYGDEQSYLNPVTYGLRVLLVMIKYLCGIYRRKR